MLSFAKCWIWVLHVGSCRHIGLSRSKNWEKGEVIDYIVGYICNHHICNGITELLILVNLITSYVMNIYFYSKCYIKMFFSFPSFNNNSINSLKQFN